jgi:LysM repeat protein
MNNPNPFLPQGSFLEQKNKARMRLKIVVYFSISLSVMVLMVLLIQGCKKPTDTADTSSTSNADTNTSMPQLPTNPPDMGMASNTTPPPETNPPVYTPPPPPPVQQAPPIAAASEDYTVVKGDTFATIAGHAHVTTKAMIDANPGVDARKLKIGQKLHIPPAASAPATQSSTSMGAMETSATGGAQTYKVKSGDTLTGIASRFHVSIKAIQSANNLTTTRLNVGKVLKIPGSSAPASAPVESLPPPSLSAPTPPPATTLPPPTH